jgi:DNA repair protein RadC
MDKKITIPIIPEFDIKLKTKMKPSELFTITNSADVAMVARQCFDADMIDWIESFVVVALNRHNKVLGFFKVSQGGVTGTVADPRVIFQFALLCNATGLVLAHNHPSGQVQPSSADIELTRKIVEAGKVLDVRVMDHVVVSSESYYSFADEGML